MMVMQENVQVCSRDPITILMACKTALQQKKVCVCVVHVITGQTRVLFATVE